MSLQSPKRISADWLQPLTPCNTIANSRNPLSAYCIPRNYTYIYIYTGRRVSHAASTPGKLQKVVFLSPPKAVYFSSFSKALALTIPSDLARLRNLELSDLSGDLPGCQFGSRKMKSENCPKNAIISMQTHHATTWALRWPERGKVPVQSNWSNCSSLASASSWKARLQWWDCKGSGSLWSKAVAGEDHWYLRMIHSYVTLFQHGIRRDHTKSIYIYNLYNKTLRTSGHVLWAISNSLVTTSIFGKNKSTCFKWFKGSTSAAAVSWISSCDPVFWELCTSDSWSQECLETVNSSCDNCLHLTSSFWHCHPWQSHHRTRRKSKASPFQLLRSLSNSQIYQYLSQQTLHNNLLQWVGDLWTTRNLQKQVQTCKKKRPNGIKRIKLYTTVIV